jgi:hypothetical protein
MTSKVYVALRVLDSPLRAFEAFTEEIALWWHPSSLSPLTPWGDGRLALKHAYRLSIVRGTRFRQGTLQDVAFASMDASSHVADWWRLTNHAQERAPFVTQLCDTCR